MKLSSQVKPISYLKSNAADIVRHLGEQQEPLIITQNGEAKVVIQDIKSYEKQLQTMMLLKALALGNQQIEAGKTQPAAQAFDEIRSAKRPSGGSGGGEHHE